ncbi:hypothetical protein T01_2132 [Trichinella spiralis]|uniref:Uncharacterized protein n=1 Tax=Trichinella spiralis TaxID=6334 RepID=A0A0V1AHU9_TRISP|nr:hypothetical protein T01_2132 [Trichinella spiralis]
MELTTLKEMVLDHRLLHEQEWNAFIKQLHHLIKSLPPVQYV